MRDRKADILCVGDGQEGAGDTHSLKQGGRWGSFRGGRWGVCSKSSPVVVITLTGGSSWSRKIKKLGGHWQLLLASVGQRRGRGDLVHGGLWSCLQEITGCRQKTDLGNALASKGGKDDHPLVV